ncbi:nickel ABC transporter permease subunit NikC [Paenibacillus elgii]|uniref:Nickel ABC transporter permease subunit NikC n=1 Tax=Paenibacillus elgii TaxID=189691 RepID=A0A2T6FXY1_9BACL|nr:nickel transporter permease [Paenibacillus elgii]PUA36757.1 nickel ABC transporter permease subunit NikC [Paenibacillus elgii]
MNAAPTALTSCRLTARRSAWRRMLRDPMAAVGIGLLTVLLLIILLGPYIVPNDPLTVKMAERLKPASLQYPLGTDHLGRCIFSRLVDGARTTLGFTGLVVLTVALIGLPLGLWSGYVGGRVDALLMRLVDGMGALPEFILAIALTGFLGPSLSNLMLSVVLVKWMGYARVVRSIVLSEREKEYVLAARVGGSGTWKVIGLHLLPHALSPVLVLAALDVGKIILTISSLSYLGLGAQPPAPEWGAMLNDGRAYFQTAPELMIYPGMAILLVVVACNLIGEGLRDLLDIRSQ